MTLKKLRSIRDNYIRSSRIVTRLVTNPWLPKAGCDDSPVPAGRGQESKVSGMP